MVEDDPSYIEHNETKCTGSDNQHLMAQLLQSTLENMLFREVEVKKISQREKVFEFELKQGDRIRILSSIATGKNLRVCSRESHQRSDWLTKTASTWFMITFQSWQSLTTLKAPL